MTCREIQPRLAGYADGELPPEERRHIDRHLAGCPACRREAEAQASIRQALAASGPSLTTPAPPWLRTRVAAQLAAEESSLVSLGWPGRLSAFAAAAMIVLAIGAVAVPIATGRSTVVLAAQLALDHLKCFTIDGHDHGDTLAVEDAEAELQGDYGWSLDVPPTAGSEEARLVAVRRCLYGEGRAAHLMYRLNGEPISLFVLHGLERPAGELHVLGQEEVVWTASGKTYMLVGGSHLRNQLVAMASNLRNEAE